MPRQRGNLIARMNFDSLTDTVTNLAGTLILVVVLVMAITSPARRGSDRPPAEGKPIGPLVKQLALIQRETQQVDEQIRRLQGDLAGLQERVKGLPAGPKPPQSEERKAATGGRGLGARPTVAALWLAGMAWAALAQQPAGQAPEGADKTDARQVMEQLQAVIRESNQALESQKTRLAALRQQFEQLRKSLPPSKPAEEQTPPAPDKTKKPAKQIVYRPPLEQLTKQSPLNFLCEDGRVSYLDLEALGRQCDSALASQPPARGQPQPFRFDLPDSDFRIEGASEQTDKGPVLRLTVIRKPSHPGETWEEIQKPASRFRRQLAGHDPKKCFVDFSVWPDSYEIFRRARSLAWKEGYDAGWSVQRTGQPLLLFRHRGPGIRIKDVR